MSQRRDSQAFSGMEAQEQNRFQATARQVVCHVQWKMQSCSYVPSERAGNISGPAHIMSFGHGKLDIDKPPTESTDTMLACSPHVVTLRERISVGTEPVSIEDFDDLVRQQEQTLLQCRGQGGSALSHFEVMTALAYKHFQQQEVSRLMSAYKNLLSQKECQTNGHCGNHWLYEG